MKPNGPVFDRSWRESCQVVPATKRSVTWMVRRHYLRRWPAVPVLILAVRHKGEFIGTIIFALPPRETSQRYGGLTWELARLWLDDLVPTNAETWLIAQAVRHIKVNHPDVRVLVSYADPAANHQGTIYKAANWIADGRTDEERITPRFDLVDADTGVRYSRQSHAPADARVEKLSRSSKHRFIYRLPAGRIPVQPPSETQSQAMLL